MQPADNEGVDSHPKQIKHKPISGITDDSLINLEGKHHLQTAEMPC